MAETSVRRLPPRCVAIAGGNLEAVEVLAQDDVDDARDGVGAVHGRGAVLEDFDTLDRRHGDRVDVDEVGGDAFGERADRDAAAVDQHQRRVGAEAAQADGDGAVGRRVLVVAARRERAVAGGRHLLEQLLQVGVARLAMSSRSTVITGDGASKSPARAMREPVTTTSSTCASAMGAARAADSPTAPPIASRTAPASEVLVAMNFPPLVSTQQPRRGCCGKNLYLFQEQ